MTSPYTRPDGIVYDVTGIGNAIVDAVASVENDFLVNENMAKGTMELVDAERSEALYSQMQNPTECSGGSVANSIAALAALGLKTAFVGRVHDDALGRVFQRDMRAIGAAYDTPFATGGLPTARCLSFVTPDAERSMSTFLGACTEFAMDDIDKQQIADSGIIYIEGYLWDQPAAKDAIRGAINTAKRTGRKVAFSLSDLFCVDRHREEFLEMIHASVDILFANAQEATALLQKNNLQDAVQQLSSMVETIAITDGAEGVWVAHKGDGQMIKADPVANVVDTTGAGDLFAAGFLAGLAQEKSLAECGALGNRCAGDIIQQFGARSANGLADVVAA